MQRLYGMGTTVELAFNDAVPKRIRGEGITNMLDRPRRLRASDVADEFTGSSEGGWIAVPAAYIESHDHKVAIERAGKRGTVWLFFRT